MKKREIIFYGIAIIALLLSLYLFVQFFFIWEQRCLGETCVEVVNGEQWINHFCSKTINGEKTCDFIAEGKQYSIPLEEMRKMDVNELSGCAKYSCQTKVFIKELNSGRLNK